MWVLYVLVCLRVYLRVCSYLYCIIYLYIWVFQSLHNQVFVNKKFFLHFKYSLFFLLLSGKFLHACTSGHNLSEYTRLIHIKQADNKQNKPCWLLHFEQTPFCCDDALFYQTCNIFWNFADTIRRKWLIFVLLVPDN